MADVVLHRLPDGLAEGTLLRWHRTAGDLVARGDGLADAGADASFLTCEAGAAGVLEILVAAGEPVAPGVAIGRLHPPGRAATGSTAKGEVTVTELTRPQTQVARRVAESRATVPTIDLTIDVDASAIRELTAPDPDGPVVRDVVVRACGLALRAQPEVNGAYRDARLERYERVNIAIPVTEDVPPLTLVAPTIFDADRRSLPEIAADARDLSARARAGELTPPEMSGATFSVWDLGSLGVDRFAALVTPPQAAALAVGAVSERPVAREGKLVVRPVVTLTLSCDHRALYGADGARFLARVRALLEDATALRDA